MKTDSQLQQDVIAELKWEPAVHAARIGVEVKDGVVTLEGRVDSYTEKWNAERATQRVTGVKALATELKVHISDLSKRTDGELAGSAAKLLEWSVVSPVNAIKVKVEHGWMTLTGSVEWQYQRQSAEASVRYMTGIVGISNLILVAPSVTATAVKAEIESALKRTAINDAKDIQVEVNGSDVTLRGSIHNWAERETATKSAWAMPGVRNVHDNMTIAYS
jgi:osmotically-inducible protein OsmY